jgi:hypothetical protein
MKVLGEGAVVASSGWLLWEGGEMTLIPAYGRDYKSKKEVQADFDADKDFVVADMESPFDGKKVNKSDLKRADVESVMIRYKGLRQVAVVKVS